VTFPRFERFRLAFGPYSGLATFAGFALIIVFGAKAIQMRSLLAGASVETAMPAVVMQVRETTCTRSMNTSIQAFNVRQRCLEVDLITDSAPEGRVARRIVVEQSNVGSLEPDDRVFVLAANTGIDRFLIVNASDSTGFFLARYAALGVALLGILLVLGSFLIKRTRAGGGEPRQA
jgi:hypothetical protein